MKFDIRSEKSKSQDRVIGRWLAIIVTAVAGIWFFSLASNEGGQGRGAQNWILTFSAQAAVIRYEAYSPTGDVQIYSIEARPGYGDERIELVIGAHNNTDSPMTVFVECSFYAAANKPAGKQTTYIAGIPPRNDAVEVIRARSPGGMSAIRKVSCRITSYRRSN